MLLVVQVMGEEKGHLSRGHTCKKVKGDVDLHDLAEYLSVYSMYLYIYRKIICMYMIGQDSVTTLPTRRK